MKFKSIIISLFGRTISDRRDIIDSLTFISLTSSGRATFKEINSNKLNNKILKDFNNGMSKINKDQFYFDYLIFNY
ncbi:hypothetical protein GCL60_08650 [Silvanigrella paludirubra]|uniref:Uncharacterized protein n=1 Tax=Silvanigrella paludirubra TaxID=2499159 RepID=A0A6N6VS28_9BACT|nr:hypothetical protein GCL60_08650 [Silvanigrella paludirubra]